MQRKPDFNSYEVKIVDGCGVIHLCFQHSEGIGRKREASLIYIDNSRPTWIYSKTLSWKETKAKNKNKVNQNMIKQRKRANEKQDNEAQ